MQRRASRRCGAVIAPVGQAVMQRVQVPQRAGCGGSGANSSVVRISARKNHVPKLRIDQHRALAMPANARFGRIIAFQHRSGVDVTFLNSAALVKKLIDLIELVLDQFVIIIAPGVTRDSSFRSAFFRALPVVQCENNDRTRAGKNQLRITSLFFAALHPMHFACCSVAQPGAKFVPVARRLATRDAAGSETQLRSEPQNLGPNIVCYTHDHFTFRPAIFRESKSQTCS